MSPGSNWHGQTFEVRLGPPGHGGFCVARHEGRVLFVRHGLPGELVRALVTEDRGGSFCRAEAIHILEPSPDRIPATCTVSGPDGAGCCDFSYATPEAQRALKATVVAEQLRRLADWEPEFTVEPIPSGLLVPAVVAAQHNSRHHPSTRQTAPGRLGGVATRLPASLTGTSTAAGMGHEPGEAAPADRRASSSRPGQGASRAGTDPTASGERAGDAPTAGPPSGQDGTRREEGVAASGPSASHASDAVRPELSGRYSSGAAAGTSAAVAASYSGGWRSRMRLTVDADGRAGVHRYRSTDVIADLRCPQPIAGAMDGIAARHWTPGADLVVAVDGDGVRHIVEIAPVEPQPRDDRRSADRRGRGGRGGGRGSAGDRRSTASRRAAAHSARSERVVEGTGRAVQYVAGRRWELSATGFWQPHFGAAQCYSDVVAEWSDARPGSLTWDLYCGVGVFAARLADQVGPGGQVHGVEFSRPAISDGRASLGDMPWVDLQAERVERWITEQPSAAPDVVVLDPPRAGAGKDVIAALTDRDPRRIIHIGCDPAAFARDLGLYRNAGYQPRELRVFDAFPATHHVECVVLLER